MSKIALPRDSEESFERIDLQNFTDILHHICYGISGADLGEKKISFTTKKLSLVPIFQIFNITKNFYFSSYFIFPKSAPLIP